MPNDNVSFSLNHKQNLYQPSNLGILRSKSTILDVLNEKSQAVKN